MKNSAMKRSTSQTVLKALAGALLPAVRLYQIGGFGIGEFQLAAKLAFVQAAAVEGRTKGGRINVSRIAAMTGLTRKEVRSLLQMQEQEERLIAPMMSRQRTARVLEAWRKDPQYLDIRGRPRILPMKGVGPSFHSLVQSYGGDVTPTSVLRELERTGAVSFLGDGSIRCRGKSTTSGKVEAAFLVEFARQLQQFGSTIATTADIGHNRVYYGFREAHVSPPHLAGSFHATFAERASNLLDGADRWVASRQRQRPGAARKAESEPQPVTVRIGVFLSDAYPQPAAPAALRPRRRTGRR